jgi:hypothetical protein
LTAGTSAFGFGGGGGEVKWARPLWWSEASSMLLVVGEEGRGECVGGGPWGFRAGSGHCWRRSEREWCGGEVGVFAVPCEGGKVT